MSNEVKINTATLEEVLDAYGSDRSRWPGSKRHQLEKFIEKDDAAQRLVREAEALERVMSASPPAVATDDLKARIMASVTNDPERAATVIPITATASGRSSTGGAMNVRTYWPAAALAASFAIGLYLGIAGLGSQAFDGAIQVSGLTAGEGNSESIYWLDLYGAALSEDTL